MLDESLILLQILNRSNKMYWQTPRSSSCCKTEHDDNKRIQTIDWFPEFYLYLHINKKRKKSERNCDEERFILLLINHIKCRVRLSGGILSLK